MPGPRLVAQKILEGLDEFYPEFLVETQLKDSKYSRIIFLNVMIGIHTEHPVLDRQTQQYLMDGLVVRLKEAMLALSDNVKGKGGYH